MDTVFYISKIGSYSEKCGTSQNPCRMFEQVWNQVEQITALSNSTEVITDTDIDINNMQIIIPNKKASLQPIYFISQTKDVNITISDCSIKGLRLLLDNTNISLYIENSTFTAAGINIQSEDNTEHLPVHIQSCHFSGPFLEDTLRFNNTDNVSIESCHFTDLQFNNDKSSVIKGINSSFHIDNSVFTNNTGSISIHGGSSQIINCSITKSRSCLKAENTTVNIFMCQFDGNTNGCIGGKNAILYIVDGNLTSNIAEHNGGAVNINSSQVTLYNCLLINNIARWYNITHITLYYPWQEDNIVGSWEGDGGAVYAHNSQVTLGNCSLINNTAGFDGGAVYVEHNSHVTLGNCSLINNTAEWGGAVYARINSNVSLVNCSLINNTAGHGGGAVCPWVNNNVKLDNCLLINNTARDGGAVYTGLNNVTLDNCSLINNTAWSGGAVYARVDNTVTLHNSSLINNIANNDGGTVYAEDSRVTLGNCSLINNTAFNWGGAVSVQVNSHVTLGNCLLLNNTARYGGAVYAVYNSNVTLDNCSLINNTAGEGGGAVYAWYNSQVTLGNCSLINNTAGRYGGAVSHDNPLGYSDMKDSVLLTDSHLNGNRAGQDGGAIYIKDAQITMKRCSLSNNEAVQGGGAVNMDMTSEGIGTENILIDNNFTQNTAVNGGALGVTSRKVTLKGCHMIDNSAKQDGGAIKVHVQSVIHMVSVQFVNNTAGLGGGAMMILDQSELLDTGSIYMQNLARGFGEYGSTFVTVAR